SEDFEYLHSRPAALFHIRQELARIGYKTKVVIYLRQQDEYARSLYVELLRHGLDRSLDQYVNSILLDGMFVHRNTWIFEFLYSRLVASFDLVLGDENVIVRPFYPDLD